MLEAESQQKTSKESREEDKEDGQRAMDASLAGGLAAHLFDGAFPFVGLMGRLLLRELKEIGL